MVSIKFPDMLSSTNVELISGYDATCQNIKSTLLSYKGELFGDPYFGSNLNKFLYEQNDAILRDLLIDDIYTCIKLFVPQIIIHREDITIESEGNTVYAKIYAKDRQSYQTNLYNIVLLTVDSNI